MLEDTFLVLSVLGWTRSARKRLTGHPRYYFFDCGVSNALTHHLGAELGPLVRGRRFEQLVVNHIHAVSEYTRLNLGLHYWRSNHGAEVDLLLTRGTTIVAAVEVKSSRSVSPADARGLREFLRAHPDVPGFILVHEQRPRELFSGAQLMDWREFVESRLPALG